MSLSSVPVYAQQPKAWGASLVNSTGAWTLSQTSTTNLVSLLTGATNGAKVEAILATTNDTSAETLAVMLNDGINNYLLGEFTVAIGAGITAGIANANVLGSIFGLPVDAAGNPYLYVPPSWTLYVGVTTSAVTSGKLTSVIATGGLF
jgi:hypothetical protein